MATRSRVWNGMKAPVPKYQVRWFRRVCPECGMPMNSPAGLECEQVAEHERAIRSEHKYGNVV